MDNPDKAISIVLREIYGNKHGPWNSRGENNSSTSRFWRGIQETKEIWTGMKFILGEGRQISFWRDKWHDYEQLKLSFPKMFEGSGNKKARLNCYFGHLQNNNQKEWGLQK